uniref:Uncharacterized protein n=1 Tax=Poecilia mexicana TaxID=48701 RepID=A0A3B3YD79_9TELE
MLNGGREGLFELGQQLQQQGEYQAALHCFLSCLLGLTHVQSFTSLPNCLHQPHLALEYSGKATKIHQRTFGNDHPITARSLELMATVYAEIGKTEYSSLGQCVSALSKRFAAAESLRDTVNCLPHSHREKVCEVRHRKDAHHQQEDTPNP